VILAALGPSSLYIQLAVFFSKTAMVTFGGAYSVLAYIAQRAVEVHGWVTAKEMLDGLGMAETTPGPLIMVLQFVGFMGAYRQPGDLPPWLAGTLGGFLTTWVTFLPCFLWIFLGAPFIERLRGNLPLTASLSAITAAVSGVILNLALWLGLRTLFAQQQALSWGPVRLTLPEWATLNAASLVISVGAFVALQWFKVGVGRVLAVSVALGIVFHLLRGG
jgi:chromate transporter